MFDRFSIDFQVTLGSLWVHFGVILGSDLAYEGDFGGLCEPFRRRKALDYKCDGHRWGLGGPKSENAGFSLVLPLLFEGSRAAKARQPNEQPSDPRW